MPEQIHRTAAQAKSRLATLGLAPNMLREAAASGRAQALLCTPHDPIGTAGYLMWARTVRFLRDELKPFGWRSGNLKNLPLVIAPDGAFAITVSRGDENTGTSGSPKTYREKGGATREAVAANQLSFVGITPGFEGVDESTRPTYFLLHHYDADKEQLRLELSLPAHVADDGFVTEWGDRIFLEPVAYTSGARVPERQGGDVDVPVQRRTAENE